jgi:ATP-dependent RNA helicase RhlE
MSFASLGLAEPIVRAVAECGYTTPTPIQSQAIPVVLSGRDLLAGAQTGTGKTAGFTLPILHRLMESQPQGGRVPIRALILTPTRELAAQVEESVRDYGRNLPLRSMVMFGGVGFQPQATRLRERVDILVATPGRLLDHAQQKTVDLSKVEILVLDEADRMLDMGFIKDIRRVLALLPKKRQNLLFSATFPNEIRELADSLLDRPASVEVARRNAPTELVTQSAIFLDKGVKRAMLAHLIRTRKWFQVLVFTRTKHGANRLAEQLTRDGIPSLAIHGNKSQGARTRALSEFKEGKLQVLVATEIAARGLDIVELPYVVNFELPNVPEDYVHRIGRTGRAGAEGVAVALVSSEEKSLLTDIERLLGKSIPRETVEGFDMNAAIAEAHARRPAELAQERPSSGRRDGQRGRSDRPRGEGRAPARAAQPQGAARSGAGTPKPAQAATRGTPGTPRPAQGGAKPAAGTNPQRPAGDGQRRRGNTAGETAAGGRRPGGRGPAPAGDRKPGGGRPSAPPRGPRAAAPAKSASSEAQTVAPRERSLEEEQKRNGRLKGALASALTALRRLGQ